MSHVRRLMETDPNWLATLEEAYKIKVVRDGRLASLKYDQTASPMGEQIVRECRGMVVDVDAHQVLAHPYNKFWNYGDIQADEIDWPSARVLEKLDGSLMILYWDPAFEQWSAASSGTPRGHGSFGDSESETFGEAFWRTFDALGMRKPPEQARRVCFMFEFCDQPNRIVVKHARPRIVLHGARDLALGTEYGIDVLSIWAEMANWEMVRSYPIASISDCLAAADALDPLECEGFVVVDAHFNRVKIKSPRYVILHHMKGEATPRRAIELWQTGEAEELLLHFPEMAPAVLPVHARLDEVAASTVAIVSMHKTDGLGRKEFADRVKLHPCAPLAFKLFASENSIDSAKQIMRKQTVYALERMIGAAR